VSDVDFSYFDLMISNFTKGKGWFSEACECDHMAVHSTYWFYFLAPFHALFSSALFLQTVHALSLWAALFPIRRLSKFAGLSNREVLLIPFFFSAYTFFIHILRYNFHFEVFYLPFMLWMLYFYKSERLLLFSLFAVFTLLVKEDAGFYLICFSAYSLFFDKRPKEGLILCALSLIITMFSLKYYIPLHRGGNYVIAGTATKYGSSFSEIIRNALTSPRALFMDIIKGGWIKVSLSLAFLPLFSTGFWISCASLIFIHSIASSPLMSGLRLYYSAPFLPFLIYFYFESLGSSKIKLIKEKKGSILVATFFIGTLLGGGFVKFEAPKEEYTVLHRFLKEGRLSGKRSCVQGSLVPHIGYDSVLTSLRFCDFDKYTYDYVILNPKLESYPVSPQKVRDFISRLSEEKKYQLEKKGTFVIFKSL
jgi:uncharacterized membrane protein